MFRRCGTLCGGLIEYRARMAMSWRKGLFLRWSFWRMVLGFRHLKAEWQVGDGREARLLDYVRAHARRGDVADAIRVIDEYSYKESFLINIGDEKGAILDAAVRRAAPKRVLELGAYCGYSALRMAAAAPQAQITSVEFSAANAAICSAVWEHAGVADRVRVVHGILGDNGQTVARLKAEHSFGEGNVDLVFLDHDKDVYLSDLQIILGAGWLHAGSIVVADNVKIPGAPEYRAYMKEGEGRRWRTAEHVTHLEYQSLVKDLVLESELIA